MDSLGERIAQARREYAVRMRKDVSPPEAADMLGVSVPTYWRWERNERKPGTPALMAIALVFGCNLDWLKTGTDPVVNQSLTTAPDEIAPEKPATPTHEAPVVPKPRGMHPLEKETPSGFPPIPSHPIRPRKDARDRKDGSG